MTADWCTSASLQTLQKRAQLLAQIRAFFAARDVMELETPLLGSYAVSELHIDSMTVATAHDGERFLGTSPEYCMKRFLAEHQQAAYQVCKCFRDGESSPLHNPEFTMLEWYRPGYSLTQLMDEVEELLQACAQALDAGTASCERISYRQLFHDVTGLDPHTATAAQLRDYATALPAATPEGLAAAADDVIAVENEKNAWLDWLMASHVSEALAKDGYTFITDYPASQAALASIEQQDGVAVARRVELYHGDLELGNGYDELTDASEQAQRFSRDNERRAREGKTAIPADRFLLAAMENGLPKTAGIAIGLDRLLMVLAGIKDIRQAVSFDYTKV